MATSNFILIPFVISLFAVSTNACCECKKHAETNARHFAQKGVLTRARLTRISHPGARNFAPQSFVSFFNRLIPGVSSSFGQFLMGTLLAIPLI